MKPIELYRVDARGNMMYWKIEHDDNVIAVHYGQHRGAIQVKTEVVRAGLASRTLEQQVHSRIRSRVNNQIDRGYKITPEEARDSVGTNATGNYKPMLAKPIDKIKQVDYNSAFIQPKLDGHRCLITKKDGQVFAYSRIGKLIPAIEHILQELQIPEGVTLDGELYCHGVPLQTIGSWIKRQQEATQNLRYHAYDLISDKPFEHRFIDAYQAIAHAPYCNLVDTNSIKSKEEAYTYFHAYKKKGYEGAIVRWGNKGYEFGKRSSHLVKIKSTMDAEFPVVEIKPSRDGWPVLTCMLPGGDTFDVVAPGTQLEKKHILEHQEHYVGKYITVKFANYTQDKKPFHPVADRWREDV